MVHEDWHNDILQLDKKHFFLQTFNNKWINRPGIRRKGTHSQVLVLMNPSSNRHQAAMVTYYDQLFFATLCMYVDLRRKPGNVYQSIRDFLKLYKITHDYVEDDYNFDSILKRYQREVKARKNRPKTDPYATTTSTR
jgi:hypothetical protein